MGLDAAVSVASAAAASQRDPESALSHSSMPQAADGAAVAATGATTTSSATGGVGVSTMTTTTATSVGATTTATTVNIAADSSDSVSLKKETVVFLQLAGPTVLAQIFQFFIWMQNAMYAGQHLGADDLAAVALGNLTANLTGLSLIMGVLSAFDTLAPQAMGGRRFAEVGVLAQRSVICTMAIMVLTLPFWWGAEGILKRLGQPPQVCALAGVFMRYYLPGIPAFTMGRVQAKFLNCQGIVMPIVVSTFISACLFHPLMLRLYIGRWQMGVGGAAAATSSTLYFMVLLTHLIIVRHKNGGGSSSSSGGGGGILFRLLGQPYNPATWEGLDLKRAVHPSELRRFIGLALPGIFGNSEWWLWEVVAFLAGMLGAAPLAAHGVAYTILPLTFMFPLGVSMALTVRVATLLGEGKTVMAKRLNWYVLGVAALVISSYAFVIYLARDGMIPWFTRDDSVAANCRIIWPHLSIFIVLDGMWGVQKGCLVALGLQSRLTLSIVVALWMIGLPLMYHLAFTAEMGLLGLWQGVWPAYALFNAFMYMSYACYDWEAASRAIVSEGLHKSARDAAHKTTTIAAAARRKAKHSEN